MCDFAYSVAGLSRRWYSFGKSLRTIHVTAVSVSHVVICTAYCDDIFTIG